MSREFIRGGRSVTLLTSGTIRDELLVAVTSTLSLPSEPTGRGDALLVVLGALDLAAGMSVDDAQAIEDVLAGVAGEIRTFVSDDGTLRADQAVVFVIDDEASLGTTARVADAVVAESAISFARALSIELRRAGTHVSVVMTAVIERAEIDQVDAVVAARIASTLDEGIETSGREDFVGRPAQLGRLRP